MAYITLQTAAVLMKTLRPNDGAYYCISQKICFIRTLKENEWWLTAAAHLIIIIIQIYLKKRKIVVIVCIIIIIIYYIAAGYVHKYIYTYLYLVCQLLYKYKTRHDALTDSRIDKINEYKLLFTRKNPIKHV